jgi:hypothetical protein
MTKIRLSLPAVIAIVLIVAAGAFAAGRSVTDPAVARPAVQDTPPSHGGGGMTADLPPGHPPAGGTATMPPGHPPVDDTAGMPPGAAAPSAGESSLTWKAPPRWKEAPNTNSMRLATYKVPGPDGEAELSVTQAGGSVEANATRWIGQFESNAQRSAKQSTKKVAGFDVTVVDIQGTYSGGMSGDGGANMALLGAIVATAPGGGGMLHFFKLTGPAKTVTAARSEFDQLVASLAQKP